MSFQVRYWLYAERWPEHGKGRQPMTQVFRTLSQAENFVDALQDEGYKSPTGFAYILDQSASGDAAVINRIGGRTFRKD